MTAQQTIRFVKPSRHNDWQKGDFGTIESVLALRPHNLSDVYVIQVRSSRVWATHEDIEAWNQLSLF